MQKTIWLALGTVLALSACDPYGRPTTDARNAGIGAAAGAVVTEATGGDALEGAAYGAAAGALCDDAGVCRR